MLIAGAGNLGKHSLDMLLYDGYKSPIAFYDDNPALPDFLYENFSVLKTEDEVQRFFQKHGPDFIATIGNNRLRQKMTLKIEAWGGLMVSLISSKAYISALLTVPSKIIIHPFVTVSHNAVFGRSCVIHANTVIGHDVVLGDFVSVATLSTIIGPCKIGDNTFIGTNVMVLPGVIIGNNAYIGTGKIVMTSIPDHGTFV